MDAFAVQVSENLHFNMPRLEQIFFEQHRLVTEARFGLASRRAERRDEILGSLDDAHTLAAAAGRRLDQHRVADRIGLAPQQRISLVRPVIAGNQRDTARPMIVFDSAFEPIALIAAGGDR